MSRADPPHALPPFKRFPQKGAAVTVDRRADGTILVRSNHAMGAAARSIPHLLAERAATHPDRDLLMQRAPDHGRWEGVTYAQAQRAAEGVAQWLLDRGLGADDALLCLSANSVAQGMMMLGCYTAGVPIAPISPAYSLISTDHAKLKHAFATVRPRVVFAQAAAPFARAFATLRALDPALVFVTVDGGGDTVRFADLAATEPTPAVAAARDALTHASVAKYLFTSGSTGMPKGVPQTQGMMVNLLAAQDGLRDDDSPPEHPVSLDWMPWSHISAGNIHFNGNIHGGGTLYLDEGKPVPGLFETTIENLRDVAPVTIGSAPIAFGMLADALEGDADFRSRFFSNLRYMTYGGATMSDDVYRRIQALAISETGHRVPLLTMYGATETQGITMTHWITERAGLVGLPLPGMVLKLAPNGSKLEIRVAGPTVTTGYLGGSGAAEWPFDDEGFYKLGDAVRFIDERDPAQGLVFDGRVAEDFKLDSGTWVSVGVLRPAIVAACSPLVQDAVIVGQDQPFVGTLLWPSSAALDHYTPTPSGLANAELGGVIRDRLFNYNRGKGSAQRIARFVLLEGPPSLDAGEITDKGNINQRTAIERRSEAVAMLYRDPPPDVVVVV